MGILLKLAMLCGLLLWAIAASITQPLAWRVLARPTNVPEKIWEETEHYPYQGIVSSDRQRVAWLQTSITAAVELCVYTRPNHALACDIIAPYNQETSWRLVGVAPNDDLYVFDVLYKTDPYYWAQWLYTMQTDTLRLLYPEDRSSQSPTTVYTDYQTGELYIAAREANTDPTDQTPTPLHIYRLQNGPDPLVHVLTTTPDWPAYILPNDIAFSADGRQVALLSSGNGRLVGVAAVQTGVFRPVLQTIDAAAALPTWYYESVFQYGQSSITWAPDGRTLLLGGRTFGLAMATLRLDSETGVVQPLFDIPPEDPRANDLLGTIPPSAGILSPDGRYFFYLNYHPLIMGNYGYTQIGDWWVMSTDPTDGPPQLAVPHAIDSCGDYMHAITIARDHQLTDYIAFASLPCGMG